jgi:hypothetical protein
VLDRGGLAGQGIQGIEQAGLVVLDRGEDVIGLLVFGPVAGSFPLRVQRDDGAVQVQRV